MVDFPLHGHDDWEFQEWHDAWLEETAEMVKTNDDWWVWGTAPPASGESAIQRTTRGGEAGPDNMATGSSQLQKWQVSGGVDTLEVTVFGSFRLSYEETQKTLEAGRQAALSRKGRRYVDVLGASLVMSEKGHRWMNTFLPWVGEYDGIKISLAKAGGSKSSPVAKVQISSLRLMRDGHREAWNHALFILDQLGVMVERTTVARIDLCVDLPGVHVGRYVDAVVEHRIITRIKSEAAFYRSADGHTWTGFAMGSRGGCRLRIYDKLAELENNPKDAQAKRAVMVERRWGVLPSAATRVEFQLNGGWLRLKWKDCQTVEQVFDRLDSIMAYLTREFFRVVDGVPDRENKNQSRCETDAMWEEVTRAACDWVVGEALPLLRMEKKPVDKKRAAKRLWSAALSAAALAPGYVVDRQSLLEYVLNSLIRTMPPEWEWLADLRRRWDEDIASGQAGVFTFEEQEGCRNESPGWRVDLVPIDGEWN